MGELVSIGYSMSGRDPGVLHEGTKYSLYRFDSLKQEFVEVGPLGKFVKFGEYIGNPMDPDQILIFKDDNGNEKRHIHLTGSHRYKPITNGGKRKMRKSRKLKKLKRRSIRNRK